MRFESVHIDRYGCLADLSTGEEPLPSIVVVLGPNESGKSTFFSFLTTLLFGFHPANRAANHPYTPVDRRLPPRGMPRSGWTAARRAGGAPAD